MAIKAKREIKKRTACSCSMPGVWRAVCKIKDVVIIFHSPRACAHISKKLDLGLHYRTVLDEIAEKGFSPSRLMTSDLNEDDAVFGGEDRLREAMRYAAKNYKPRAIFVANSCVAGVIGDDSEAVGREMQEELGIPVCVSSAHGFFDSGYFSGYLDMVNLLFDRFVPAFESNAPKENKVLLVADTGAMKSDDMRTFRRLLGYFGFEDVLLFSALGDLDEYKKVGNAKLVIVLSRYQTEERNRGLSSLADKIASRLNVPVVSEISPIGLTDTFSWLKQIGEKLEAENNAEKAIAAEKKLFEENVLREASLLRGKKTVLCSGKFLRYFQPEKLYKILSKAGVEVLGFTLFETVTDEDASLVLERLKSAAPEIKLLNEEEREAAFKEADFVLTSHELLNNDIKQVFVPMLSDIGWQGEYSLIEAVKNVICRHPARGGLVYA